MRNVYKKCTNLKIDYKLEDIVKKFNMYPRNGQEVSTRKCQCYVRSNFCRRANISIALQFELASMVTAMPISQFLGIVVSESFFLF